MLRSISAATVGVAIVGLFGCASTTPKGATVQQLENRAVFDLGCAQQQLWIYDLDARTKAVVGCGRRLVYIESCEPVRGETTCTWIMNTPTDTQMQWPQWQTAQAGAGHPTQTPPDLFPAAPAPRPNTLAADPTRRFDPSYYHPLSP